MRAELASGPLLLLLLLLLQGGFYGADCLFFISRSSLSLPTAARLWRHSDVTAVDLTAWVGPGFTEGWKGSEKGAGLGDKKGYAFDQP